MSRRMRMLRCFLTAGAPRTPAGEFWRRQRSALVQAALLVRVFYLCQFFIQLQLYPNWDSWLATKDLRLLWPVAWFAWTGTRLGVAVVVFGSMFASLLAAAFPRLRFCRAVAAIAILGFGGFFNSFGTINHGWHAWIWTSAIFVFLPDGPADALACCTSSAQRYLRVFWAAQFAILMTYSMSGAFKVAAGVVQLAQGQSNTFSPDALARHIAYRLLEGTHLGDYMLGPYLIRHPYVGWPIYLLGLYIERIFTQVKRRQIFIVRERTFDA